MIAAAALVVFLGFGFDRTNIKRLEAHDARALICRSALEVLAGERLGLGQFFARSRLGRVFLGDSGQDAVKYLRSTPVFPFMAGLKVNEEDFGQGFGGLDPSGPE